MSAASKMKPGHGSAKRKNNVRSKREKRDDDVMNVRAAHNNNNRLDQQPQLTLTTDERQQHCLQKMCFEALFQQGTRLLRAFRAQICAPQSTHQSGLLASHARYRAGCASVPRKKQWQTKGRCESRMWIVSKSMFSTLQSSIH